MQEFNSDTYAWNSDEAALPANPKNIKEASDWVRSLSSDKYLTHRKVN